MKILLAEDDTISRRIMAAQLAKLQHEVFEARDGAIAWDVYQQESPDLVITDWMMPHVDGLELCRRIRAAARPSYTYLIILTALDRKVGYLDGMGAGADDFMTKPCENVELSVRLRAAERILSLQTRVSKLEELLPICPNCKKIHDDNDTWQPVESYFMKRTEALFSHGICPECFERYMKPQLEELRKSRG